MAVHGIIAAAAAVAAPAARTSISPPSPLLDTAHARGGKALVSCMCNSDSDSAGEPESVTSQEHDGEGAALPASAPPLMIVQIATSCTYPLTTSQIFNDGGGYWGMMCLVCGGVGLPDGRSLLTQNVCHSLLNSPPSDTPPTTSSQTSQAQPFKPRLTTLHLQQSKNPPPSPVLWCAAHRRPFTLAMRPSRGMRPDQQYDDDACNKIKKAAAAKVAPLVWLLR